MKDMILFPEDIERLDNILIPLVTKAKLLLAVLINRDGRILTHQGHLERVDVVSLAALVAGNTASTLAIANIVGETEFSALYHQGKERNIYIDATDDNTYLSVVFDDRTNVDRVKVFIRQFERELREALSAVYNKTEDDIDLDLDMGVGSFQEMQGEQPPVISEEARAAQRPGADGPYRTPGYFQAEMQAAAESTYPPPVAGSGGIAAPPSSEDAYRYLRNKRKPFPASGK